MRTRASLVILIALIFLVVGCSPKPTVVRSEVSWAPQQFRPRPTYPTTTTSTAPPTTVPRTTLPPATTPPTTRQAVAQAPRPVYASSASYTGKWVCIAFYESTDEPGLIDPPYYSGLQFTLQTWAAMGGVGNPAYASIAEQETVADRVLAAQGWGAWPVSSRRCGYR